MSTVCLQALPLSLSHRKFGYDISLHPHASSSEQTFRDGEGHISNAPSPIVFSLISVSFRGAALSFALRTSCHASSQIGQNFYRKFAGFNSNVCLPAFVLLLHFKTFLFLHCYSKNFSLFRLKRLNFNENHRCCVFFKISLRPVNSAKYASLD